MKIYGIHMRYWVKACYNILSDFARAMVQTKTRLVVMPEVCPDEQDSEIALKKVFQDGFVVDLRSPERIRKQELITRLGQYGKRGRA